MSTNDPAHKPRPCEYRDSRLERGQVVYSDWTPGVWHAWSLDHDECESGPMHWPAAIVEDPKTGTVHVVYAGHVRFSPEGPAR